MWPNPQFPADFFIFTEEILNGNFIFCAVWKWFYFCSWYFWTSLLDWKSCHWLADDNSLTFVFTFSIKNLLALPISFFAGFISLDFGFDLKFFLWSFRVINAFVLVKQSISNLKLHSYCLSLLFNTIICFVIRFPVYLGNAFC